MGKVKAPFLFLFLFFSHVLSEASGPSIEGDRCFIDVQSDEPECWLHGGSQTCHYHSSPLEGGSHTIPNGCMRSNIFDGGYYLVAYPSTGGVVFLERPSAVDLQHLGLPHTYDAERLPEEDDAIATRMVQLGAQWWPSWALYFRHEHRINIPIFYDYHMPPDVHVALPSTGGAWLANFTRDEPRYETYPGQTMHKHWLPARPHLWHKKMGYALTMDDKSEMMKGIGAVFYDSIDEMPGAAKTIEDAMTLFEPFRERLRKMEDQEYWSWFGHQSLNDVDDTDIPGEQTVEDKPRWGFWSLFG